jgi:hypothetical protein
MTLVQIALAVKDVPFNDIVFVQYPTLTDPSDANRVVPNKQAAAALWEALEANQPLELTGKASQGDGVIVEGGDGSTPTDAPAPPTDAGAPTPGDGSTPDPQPSESAVALPSAIAGQTAAQNTCSNGNLRG